MKKLLLCLLLLCGTLNAQEQDDNVIILPASRIGSIEATRDYVWILRWLGPTNTWDIIPKYKDIQIVPLTDQQEREIRRYTATRDYVSPAIAETPLPSVWRKE